MIISFFCDCGFGIDFFWMVVVWCVVGSAFFMDAVLLWFMKTRSHLFPQPVRFYWSTIYWGIIFMGGQMYLYFFIGMPSFVFMLHHMDISFGVYIVLFISNFALVKSFMHVLTSQRYLMKYQTMLIQVRYESYFGWS